MFFFVIFVHNGIYVAHLFGMCLWKLNVMFMYIMLKFQILKLKAEPFQNFENLLNKIELLIIYFGITMFRKQKCTLPN